MLKISQNPTKQIWFFDAPFFDSGFKKRDTLLTQLYYPIINESFEIIRFFYSYIRNFGYLLCDPTLSNLGFKKNIIIPNELIIDK